MRTSWIVLALVVGSALVAPTRAAAKLPPCPGGRYLVAGSALMPGLDGTSPDVVEVAGRMVSVMSGCPPVKAKVRATAHGTKIRARWKACPSITGKAILVATITEQCRTLAATFRAKAAGIAKPFLGSLSLCGDGVWDPDAGEACDAGLGPCGALCNQCTCAGVTTTTTGSGTTEPSSTTEPSASSSTTTTPTTPTTSTTSGAPVSTTTTTAVGSTITTTTAAGPTTTSIVPTTTSIVPTTTSVVPTTTSIVPTTTSIVPTTTSTTAAIPTTTSTTSPGGTTSSSMPAIPTTSTTSTTLARPDLAGLDWMSPGSAPSGTNIAIQYTIKNFGTATATAPWYDYILFSDDLAIGNDTAIAVTQRATNLAAGTQYTVLLPQVPIPAVPAGTYYLFLHTDGSNAVVESNEDNNIGAVQLIVTP